MDLDSAIKAHAQWKMTFRSAISNKQRLDAATIAKDDCCELGKWLHGEARGQLGGKPQYATLLQRHKEFHTEAGKVAALINSNQFDRASQAIENGTPFAGASNDVGVAVIALRKAQAVTP